MRIYFKGEQVAEITKTWTFDFEYDEDGNCGLCVARETPFVWFSKADMGYNGSQTAPAALSELIDAAFERGVEDFNIEDVLEELRAELPKLSIVEK